MPKHDIIPQLVHILSSENSELQKCGTDTLLEFARSGEHVLAWNPFSNSDGCLEDVRALMPKDGIISQLVHMLSSENSAVQVTGLFGLSKFLQFGERELV